MMLFESLIFNLLPAAVGIMVLVLVFESCWRKCPPDKLMIDQVASGLKDSTGIDLPSLLNGLISNPDIDVDSAENSVE